MAHNLPVVISIAGSDGSSGAGIQADLKTFSALGVYGLTVITAITVQNTTKVKNVHPVSLNLLKEQLDILFSDFDIKFAKIGMLATSDIAKLTIDYLKEKRCPFILDPVLKSSTGTLLFDGNFEELIKGSFLITPNLDEASYLTGLEINSLSDMEKAAKIISAKGAKYVLIKGGHLKNEKAIDMLYDGRSYEYFISDKIKTKNTHGTGCTLSSAITAYLAKGENIVISIRKAKEFLIKSMLKAKNLNLGHGRGPLIHFEI